MDKKALQEQFEAIAIQNCWNINKYPAGWDGHGDDEYADDFVSGAWWAFQHQQAKVDELQTHAQEIHKREIKLFEKTLILTHERDELQKRVETARELVAGIKDGFFGECYEVHDISKKLEQALKGEG